MRHIRAGKLTETGSETTSNTGGQSFKIKQEISKQTLESIMNTFILTLVSFGQNVLQVHAGQTQYRCVYILQAAFTPTEL